MFASKIATQPKQGRQTVPMSSLNYSLMSMPWTRNKAKVIKQKGLKSSAACNTQSRVYYS